MEGARPERGDAPRAVRRLGRHRFGAVEHGAGDLERAEHLAQLLLNVQEAGDADASASFIARPQKNSIWLSMRAAVWFAEHHRRAAEFVCDFAAARPAVDHDAVPGDEHIVEHRNAVHLLKTAAQRVVEAVVRARRHGLAADQLEAGMSVGMENDTA